MKYKVLVLWLLLLSGIGTVSAAPLTVSGLGTFPLHQKMEVVDGRGTSMENLFKERGKVKNHDRTDMAKILNFFAVPPGMNLHPDEEPHPYDNLELYQVRTADVRGRYSALVSIVSGDKNAVFQGKKEKVISFWENAFAGKAERPESLFGKPKISIEEYQRELNQYLKENKGEELQVRLISFTPWRAYENGDGSYRWSQEARIIISNEKNISFPLWLYSNVYKEGDRYYIVLIQGSHTAAEKMGEELLYGLYGLERNRL